MSQSIVNDPKSWGRITPDPLAQLRARCHAEVDAIFADPNWRTELLNFMKDSEQITIHLSMKPPYY